MSDPRRWIDEGEGSLEGALFRAGRAEAAPAAAKAQALAALGLVGGGEQPEARAPRHDSARPATMPRRLEAGPGAALFRGVLGAERRPSRGLGAVQVAGAALAAAAAMALLVTELGPRRSAGVVEVDLRAAGSAAPRAAAPTNEEAPPVKIAGRDPAYTPEAIEAGAEGAVVVKCVVTTEGTLADCEVLQSVPAMDRAVLDALATWRFSPAMAQGRPVAVEQVFTVRLPLPR